MRCFELQCEIRTWVSPRDLKLQKIKWTLDLCQMTTRGSASDTYTRISFASTLTYHFRQNVKCWLTRQFLQYSTILIPREKKENYCCLRTNFNYWITMSPAFSMKFCIPVLIFETYTHLLLVVSFRGYIISKQRTSVPRLYTANYHM